MTDFGSIYTPESWEYSRGYAGVFGVVPSSFTSVTRALMAEHANQVQSTGGTTKYFVLRLLKSPSLFAPFYFAYCGFSGTPISENHQVTAEEITKYFTPFELSYILGLTYVFRRAKTLCDAKEWEYVATPMMLNISAGYLAGRAVPAITGAMGMIEGSIRHLAAATFLKHDAAGFQDFRRELKKRGQEWDDAGEAARWGCTNLQIASVFLQTLGFGIPRANAFVNAFSGHAEVGTADEVRYARDFRMANTWRQLLLAGESEPKFSIPAQYYPKRADLKDAMTRLEAIKSDERLSSWLIRTKADLPGALFDAPAPVEPAVEPDTAALSAEVEAALASVEEQAEGEPQP